MLASLPTSFHLVISPHWKQDVLANPSRTNALPMDVVRAPKRRYSGMLCLKGCPKFWTNAGHQLCHLGRSCHCAIVPLLGRRPTTVCSTEMGTPAGHASNGGFRRGQNSPAARLARDSEHDRATSSWSHCRQPLTSLEAPIGSTMCRRAHIRRTHVVPKRHTRCPKSWTIAGHQLCLLITP